MINTTVEWDKWLSNYERKKKKKKYKYFVWTNEMKLIINKLKKIDKVMNIFVENKLVYSLLN